MTRDYTSSGLYPVTCLIWVALLGASASASIALRAIGARKTSSTNKTVVLEKDVNEFHSPKYLSPPPCCIKLKPLDRVRGCSEIISLLFLRFMFLISINDRCIFSHRNCSCPNGLPDIETACELKETFSNKCAIWIGNISPLSCSSRGLPRRGSLVAYISLAYEKVSSHSSTVLQGSHKWCSAGNSISNKYNTVSDISENQFGQGHWRSSYKMSKKK
jgi:hypothetical protein